MSGFKWWGSKRSITDSNNLQQFTSLFDEDVPQFNKADKIAVIFRKLVIFKEEDWATDNDLIVVSTFQFDDEPQVTRLHYLKHNVPIETNLTPFFHDLIFSTNDFNDSALTLEIKVYDLDDMDEDIINSVTGVAQTAAVAFPQIAPFTAFIGLVGASIIPFINSLDEHDVIIHQKIKFEISDEGTGISLLQPGYYVCFNQDVDNIKIDSNLQILDVQDDTKTNLTHAIIELRNDHIEGSKWVINQKIAKLISELEGKGNSGKDSLEFLKETMKGYDSFKKLKRVSELKAKANRTTSEEELLEELIADEDINDYITA